MQQSTKPQTLAYGLTDLPTGFAGWIVEKFKTWTDNDGAIEDAIGRDELLTNISLYWFTQTINSASRLCAFSERYFIPPKEFAERFFNVQRWKKMDKGGHFAAMEEPEELAEEIRAFAKEIATA